MTEFLVYLLVLVIISLGAVCLYANDKMRSKNELWRIPETWLLAVGFFGGAAGALAAMFIFRHKTKRWYFLAINIFGLVWQLILAAYLLAVGI